MIMDKDKSNDYPIAQNIKEAPYMYNPSHNPMIHILNPPLRLKLQFKLKWQPVSKIAKTFI